MTQANIDPAQMQQMAAALVPLFGVFVLVLLALLIVPFWFAFKKAGLSPWLSLLVLIPGIGVLVTLYVLAFARWRVVPMAAEYPPYPPANYMQPPSPQQGGIAYPPSTAYPAPSAAYPPRPQTPLYPPSDPSSGS